MTRPAPVIVIGVGAAVVILDQVTKAWAVAELQGEPPIQVIGTWLQWSFATNSGAAFSLGSGNTWLFTAFAAVIISAVLWYTPRVGNRWWALALGLVLGGGTGNFIDRLLREPSFGQGHVIDFIRVPNWPVFNIADMAVVSGAALAVLLSMRGVDARGPSADSEPAESAA